MRTISLLLLNVFLSCPAVPGQTTPTDSNTLRAIQRNARTNFEWNKDSSVSCKINWTGLTENWNTRCGSRQRRRR